MLRKLDVVDDVTPERFLRDYVLQNRPVILERATEHWPAFGKWSAEYLKATIGHRELRVEEYPDRGFLTAWAVRSRPHVVERRMSARDYVEKLEAARPERFPKYYLGDCDLNAETPELSQDIRPLQHLPKERFLLATLFLGRDAASPPHFHQSSEAILSVVTGQKHVVLYPPEDTWNLYPKPITALDHNQSTIDFSALDRSRYPRLERTRPIDVPLKPGQSLYIPVHWWHLVTGTGLHASVTHFWKASMRQWNVAVGARTVVANVVAMGLERARGLFSRGEGH